MYCINCGQEIDDGSVFCMYCGTRIEDEPKQEESPAQKTTEEETPSYTVVDEMPPENPKKPAEPAVNVRSLTNTVFITGIASLGVTATYSILGFLGVAAGIFGLIKYRKLSKAVPPEEQAKKAKIGKWLCIGGIALGAVTMIVIAVSLIFLLIEGIILAGRGFNNFFSVMAELLQGWRGLLSVLERLAESA